MSLRRTLLPPCSHRAQSLSARDLSELRTLSNPPKLVAVVCEAACLLMGFSTASEATSKAGDKMYWWGISKKRLFLNTSAISDLVVRLSSDEMVEDGVFKRAVELSREVSELDKLNNINKAAWGIGLFCKARVAFVEARSGSATTADEKSAATTAAFVHDATTSMEQKRERCAKALEALDAL